tara:strand:+ start:30 stop:461 length:432 start_codon:yes stop_codon:yes gene_type:complete
MEEVIKDGWQIIPADYKNTAYSSTGYYSSQPESYFKEQFAEDHPKLYKEHMIIRGILELAIPGEYGYYFSEVHEHDKPTDIPDVPRGEDGWRVVYDTPLALYHSTGEYSLICYTNTEEYSYYSISLHGSSFQSALTEYVRIAK